MVVVWLVIGNVMHLGEKEGGEEKTNKIKSRPKFTGLDFFLITFIIHESIILSWSSFLFLSIFTLK